MKLKGCWPIVVAAVVLLMCCSPERPVVAAAKSGSARKTVRLGLVPFLSSAPIFIAIDEGFFNAEGLDVKVIEMRGNAFVPAMARGDIDVFATLVYTGLFSAIGKGVPMRIVADKSRPTRDGCGVDGLLASNAVADRPRSATSLRGAKISVSDASAAEYALDSFLESGGVSRGDMQFTYVQRPNAGEALANGAIDFRMASEPDIASVVQRGNGKLWMKAADMQPELQWATIVFGKSLLEDRETGRRFLRGYLRGVKRYNEGKTPRNVAIAMRATGLSEEMVRAACWTQIRDDGAVNARALVAFQEWAKRRGYIDRVLEPSEFLDSWFVEHAGEREATP
ncbi:MAG: ABC transporter substrate-binding protein [Thermoanaerobaculia bacterium]